MHYEVLMDRKENTRKCTIHPLRERKDFTVRYFRSGPIPAFQADFLLHVDGKDLRDFKNSPPQSIAVIDCNWRKVPWVVENVAKPLPTLVKIPEGFVTAYPRRNKEGKDPDAGLATIEAVFIAAAFCGVWDESLLEHYHFAENFLAMNAANWQEYGLKK